MLLIPFLLTILSKITQYSEISTEVCHVRNVEVVGSSPIISAGSNMFDPYENQLQTLR